MASHSLHISEHPHSGVDTGGRYRVQRSVYRSSSSSSFVFLAGLSGASVCATRRAAWNTTPFHHASSSNFNQETSPTPTSTTLASSSFHPRRLSEHQSARLGAQRGRLRRQLPPLKHLKKRHQHRHGIMTPADAVDHATTSRHNDSWQSWATIIPSITPWSLASPRSQLQMAQLQCTE